MTNTIESIENDFWEATDFNSHLAITCYKLRKKNLDDFEVEDLRMMIAQNIALPILIPMAIKELKIDILAEGDFFEGDLLMAVLTSEKEFWYNDKDAKHEVLSLVNGQLNRVREMDSTEAIRNSILDAFEQFK